MTPSGALRPQRAPRSGSCPFLCRLSNQSHKAGKRLAQGHPANGWQSWLVRASPGLVGFQDAGHYLQSSHVRPGPLGTAVPTCQRKTRSLPSPLPNLGLPKPHQPRIAAKVVCTMREPRPLQDLSCTTRFAPGTVARIRGRHILSFKAFSLSVPGHPSSPKCPAAISRSRSENERLLFLRGWVGQELELWPLTLLLDREPNSRGTFRA